MQFVSRIVAIARTITASLIVVLSCSNTVNPFFRKSTADLAAPR